MFSLLQRLCVYQRCLKHAKCKDTLFYFVIFFIYQNIYKRIRWGFMWISAYFACFNCYSNPNFLKLRSHTFSNLIIASNTCNFLLVDIESLACLYIYHQHLIFVIQKFFWGVSVLW